jgi:hypothetical protein
MVVSPLDIDLMATRSSSPDSVKFEENRAIGRANIAKNGAPYPKVLRLEGYSALTMNFSASNFPIEDNNEEIFATARRIRPPFHGRPPLTCTGWVR